MYNYRLLFYCLLLVFSCNETAEKERIRIGFLDFIVDETIASAKQGFLDALSWEGYRDGIEYELIYANAQGDIPTLSQSCDYIISKDVDLIASNVTLSTITAVQKTASIPIFMMVSPSPAMAGLLDNQGNVPPNLFGVYENLDYLNIAVEMIKTLSPETKRIATIYNQAELQSVMAHKKLSEQCQIQGIELISASVSSSAETQLITQSLINRDVDAFFALPDNIVFASFETIADVCSNANIPVFTSESGLVARGALASYGADFYQWGFQTGLQAVKFLNTKTTEGLQPELVLERRKIINAEVAQKYGIDADSSFVMIE